MIRSNVKEWGLQVRTTVGRKTYLAQRQKAYQQWIKERRKLNYVRPPPIFDMFREATEDLDGELHKRASWATTWIPLIPKLSYPDSAPCYPDKNTP